MRRSRRARVRGIAVLRSRNGTTEACQRVGLCSGVHRMFLNKSCDQTKECLLFWTCATPQEGRNFLVFNLPSRRRIGFVTDEHSPGRITDQVPAVAAGAFIELARFLHEGSCRFDGV